LERRGHDLSWLPRSVAASGDFGPGLVEFGFDFVGQLKLVIKVIVDPLADLFNFLARQVWDRRLNFFDRAHANNLAQCFPMRREKLRAALKTATRLRRTRPLAELRKSSRAGGPAGSRLHWLRRAMKVSLLRAKTG